jgi:predicted secreted protein
MLAMRRARAARACQSDGSDDWVSAMARLINGYNDKWWREKIRSAILVILAILSPSSDSG